MSRIAKSPIMLPEGVKATLQKQHITIEGPQGKLERTLHPSVQVKQEENTLVFSLHQKVEEKTGWMFAGTMRALVNNMVIGVSQGYEVKLMLVGVGYRAAAQGDVINLVLGFSHPVNFKLPQGVKVEIPAQNEIILKSIDKHLLKQTAANIRAYRRPEPYKGKGVRFADERVVLKDVKKK